MYDPISIDVIPPGVADHPLADGRVIFVEDRSGVVVTVIWGTVGNMQQFFAELERIRSLGPIHEISFEDISCDKIVHLNSYMPRLTRNVLGYDPSGSIVYGPLTLSFRQTDPATQIVPLLLWARGIIATGDGKYKLTLPAAGRISQVEGYIRNLGTGGGQTRIQLRIGLTDYLSVRGDFVVASGTNRLENQVLVADTSFIRDTVLELDVDSIPGNTDSIDACIVVWCELFRAGRAL